MRVWPLAVLAVAGCATPATTCGFKMLVHSTVLRKSTCRSELVGRLYPQAAPTVRVVITRRETCRAVELQTFSDGSTRHVLTDPWERDHELNGVVVSSDDSAIALVRSSAEVDVAQIVGARFSFEGERVKREGHTFPERWSAAVHDCESVEGVVPGDATPEQVHRAEACLEAGWQLPGGWFSAVMDAQGS